MKPENSIAVRTITDQTLVGQGFTAKATYRQYDLVESARAVAMYERGYLSSFPAVFDHTSGAGSTVYIGTTLDQNALGSIVCAVLDRAGVRPVHEAPAGVEVAERRTAASKFLFLLNHDASEATVRLDRQGGIR